MNGGKGWKEAAEEGGGSRSCARLTPTRTAGTLRPRACCRRSPPRELTIAFTNIPTNVRSNAFRAARAGEGHQDSMRRRFSSRGRDKTQGESAGSPPRRPRRRRKAGIAGHRVRRPWHRRRRESLFRGPPPGRRLSTSRARRRSPRRRGVQDIYIRTARTRRCARSGTAFAGADTAGAASTTILCSKMPESSRHLRRSPIACTTPSKRGRGTRSETSTTCR